jgi:hypothetical protein
MLAIAFESLDLDKDHLYKYGTYAGGRGLADAIGTQPVSWRDSPRWGLIAFLGKWLKSATDAVTVCENVFATRKHLHCAPKESRIACYGEEVYHILNHKDADNEAAIECALRESTHHWATGVCALHAHLPAGDIPSETFFDILVAHTAHIFTPALDGEGYLIWSPNDG